jgi:Zn-dependent M16 (insulinase) family peptidase
MIHHFSLIKEEKIPELKSIARLYRHETTEARLLSIINADENKCFSINFKTPPKNSSGIAHILEHSVLNGSTKYPVKEPFIELLKGSLATFINAFTFPDKTCYPVASQNTQDFYNLIDVYMDAVFNPLISPLTFQQEGWHYEINDIKDPLVYKGVVFNEMKGALSSPERVQEESILAALFPGHTYGYNAGGDPVNIPDLDFEEIKQFHDTFYHPSNAYIYFYGDDDPEKRLELMDGYLKPYQAIEIDSSVPPILPLKQPQIVELHYDAGQDSGSQKKSYFTVNWTLPDKSDPLLVFSFDILAHILIGTPASPLRKALIGSGLGDDLTGLGLENIEHREQIFSTGLKGLSSGNSDKVEKLIFNTLETLVKDGIDREMIEAALNTVEFQLREHNTGAFPRGLDFMVRIMTTWLYDEDPIKPIAFEKPLLGIKEKLKQDEHYFEGMIRKYLLDNPFRASVLLIPDGNVAREREMAEKARLEKCRAGMSEKELQQLVDSTLTLKKRQETPDTREALASLPMLKLEDLEKKVKSVPISTEKRKGVEILNHDLFTNGIVYLDLGFNLAMLPADLLPFTEIFGSALLEMGTETEDYVMLAQRIGKYTGGIECHPLCLDGYQSTRSFTRLILRAKSTLQQSGQMLSILRDVLLSVKLDDPERFKQIVLEHKAGIETQLAALGHDYANKRLQAHFSTAGWATEQINGVSSLFFLRRLAEEISQDWKGVLTRLQTIRKLLINRPGLICNVTLDNESWKNFSIQLDGLLESLPENPIEPVKWEITPPAKTEGLAIPAQVNYVGKAANLYSLGYRLDGSAEVIFNYLRTTFLWEKIRVQGGAYGVFVVFDPNSGVLSFVSFRDPNLSGTLENYSQAASFLTGLKADRLTDDELLKGIIGAIGLLDAYQLPDARGFSSMRRYLTGETDEIRQKYRDEVLSTRQADFNDFGRILEKAMKIGVVSVVGALDTMKNAQADLSIVKVM